MKIVTFVFIVAILSACGHESATAFAEVQPAYDIICVDGGHYDKQGVFSPVPCTGQLTPAPIDSNPF